MEQTNLLTSDTVVNPWAKWDEAGDTNVPPATLAIYNYIAGYLLEKDYRDVCRCSAATMCPKRRQFQRMGATGKPMTPRKEVNFLLGDLAERTLMFFIKNALVGPGKLYSEIDLGDVLGSIEFNRKKLDIYKQKELKANFDGLAVSGHADGFGKRNSDGEWELIEDKSSANWGFAEFKEEGAGDYLRQSHALMMTDLARERNVKSVRFFYLRKETGHVWDHLHYWDQMIADQVVADFKRVMDDTPIPVPFPLVDEMEGRGAKRARTGRTVAKFPCDYCPFIQQCHGSHIVEFKSDQHGNQRPVYIFRKKG